MASSTDLAGDQNDPLQTPTPLSITTDQADYAPGSTATFTATAALAGTVEFSVAHVDAGADGIIGTADDALVHDLSGTTAPWTVTDGAAGDLDGAANGAVVTSWNVGQDAASQAFVVSATDSSGATATASFTDTQPLPPSTAGAAADLTADGAPPTPINGALFEAYHVHAAGTGV